MKVFIQEVWVCKSYCYNEALCLNNRDLTKIFLAKCSNLHANKTIAQVCQHHLKGR